MMGAGGGGKGHPPYAYVSAALKLELYHPLSSNMARVRGDTLAVELMEIGDITSMLIKRASQWLPVNRYTPSRATKRRYRLQRTAQAGTGASTDHPSKH